VSEAITLEPQIRYKSPNKPEKSEVLTYCEQSCCGITMRFRLHGSSPGTVPAVVLLAVTTQYARMFMKNSTKLLTLALAVSAVAFSANAIPTLTLNDGVNPPVTVVDGGFGDLNAVSGAVTWSGSIGNWILNVTTGVTKPAIGSAAGPEMDLASVNATSVGGGTLKMYFSESGFIPSGSANNVIGGTLAHGSTLTASSWANASQVTLQNFLNGGSADHPFSGSANGSLTAAPGYTLTLEIDVHHNGTGITSFNDHLSVPDGGLTAGLLGFALVAVEGLRRRLSR
jgi:hypothetical protein